MSNYIPLSEIKNNQARRFSTGESAYERSVRAEAARREYRRLYLGQKYSVKQTYADALLLGRVNGVA